VEAGNMCAVILREVTAVGNETVALRGGPASFSFLPTVTEIKSR